MLHEGVLDMNALELFRKKKKEVVDMWIEAVFKTYPLDTTGFLRTKKHDFSNPVGEITSTVGNYIFDAVAGEHILEDRLSMALERFVKLRSVQDFTPSQGLGVLLLFKQLFRKVFLEEFENAGQIAVYLEAESRVDTICLMAFEMYVTSRDTISQMRITEIRNGHSQIVRLAQRHGLVPKELTSIIKD